MILTFLDRHFDAPRCRLLIRVCFSTAAENRGLRVPRGAHRPHLQLLEIWSLLHGRVAHWQPALDQSLSFPGADLLLSGRLHLGLSPLEVLLFIFLAVEDVSVEWLRFEAGLLVLRRGGWLESALGPRHGVQLCR